MNHLASEHDREFRARLESCEVAPADFDHRAHLRLAYVYLTENDVETAQRLMRTAILGLLECNRLEPSKYHETMTHAWILAVRHFMQKTPHADSADSFIEQNPMMLDSGIMLTHYSAAVLFSDAARGAFHDPDRDPIPRHESP